MTSFYPVKSVRYIPGRKEILICSIIINLRVYSGKYRSKAVLVWYWLLNILAVFFFNFLVLHQKWRSAARGFTQIWIQKHIFIKQVVLELIILY
jgi:hypothetical protein